MRKLKIILLLILVIMCMTGCSKYQHSSTIKHTRVDSTENLDEEEKAAIKEEEEYLSQFKSNIDVKLLRDNLNKSGFKEEVAQGGKVYYFTKYSDSVTASIATEDQKTCYSINVSVKDNYKSEEGADKELICLLKDCLGTIDPNYTESDLTSLIKQIDQASNGSIDDGEDYKLTDKITYSICLGEEEFNIYLNLIEA